MDPPSPLKGPEEGLQKYQANDLYYDHTEWTGRELERDSSLLYFSKLSYMDFCRFMDEAAVKPTGILVWTKFLKKEERGKYKSPVYRALYETKEIAEKIYKRGKFTIKKTKPSYFNALSNINNEYTFWPHSVVTLLPYVERLRQERTWEAPEEWAQRGKGKGKATDIPPPKAPALPPPNLAAVIKASRFVGVDELTAAFKVQTGRPVAATQLEILGMKTAEF